MTVRAFIIGLIAALFIAGFGYYNDQVLGLESFTSGHLLPIVVFGGIFALVAGANPLLHRFRASWALRPEEVAVVIVLACAACSIPGRGLMEQFTQILVMPHRLNETRVGWDEQGILDYAPDGALVDATDYNETVTKYYQGAPSQGAQKASVVPSVSGMSAAVERVPWSAWRRPMLIWLPLIILLGIATVTLALVLHKQWSKHELLPYPIANFSAALIEREKDRPFPTVFYNRLFWIGFATCIFIRLWNALVTWQYSPMPEIPLNWNFMPLFANWTEIKQTTWFSYAVQLSIFPLAIAFAFFLRGDVAFTLGISQWAWALCSLPLVSVGILTASDYATGGFEGWHRAGAYTALALMLAYAGRQYYATIAKRAILFWRPHPVSVSRAERVPERVGEPQGEVETVDAAAGEGVGSSVSVIVDDDRSTVWAARICMLSVLASTLLFIRLGLPWTIAVALNALIMMTMIGVSRISAETGLFFVQPRWQAYGAILGLFGGYAMGPRGLLVAALICVVLTIDQSQALMPYLTNGLKLGERFKLPLPRVAAVSLGAWIPALFVALVVVLAVNYTFGAVNNTSANWSLERIPATPFRTTFDELMHLKATDRLEASESMGAVSRLFEIRPKRYFLLAAGSGFILVLVCSILRMRLTWWPIHPILFLVWATYPMGTLSSSLFLGWIVKVLVQRYGGHGLAKRLQPLMIGIIGGEVIGAACIMVIGALVYMITGEALVPYRYFPR